MDINNIPATDIDSYINKSAKKGAEIVANPSSVLAGLPKPSIIQTAMAGLQGGMAYQPPAGVSPLMAGLGGLVGGYQGAQQAEMSALEMAPFEQVSPILANEFPMFVGMPSKMVTDLLKTLSGYFSARSKPQAPEDTITEEMANYYSSKFGVEPDILKQMGKKAVISMARTSILRPTKQFEVIKNEYGIPVSVQGVSSTGAPFMMNIAQNVKATNIIKEAEKAKKISDELIEYAMSLQPSNSAIRQRIKGRAMSFANVLGLGGEEAQKYGILQSRALGLSSLISKGVLSESGVLTDRDVARALALLGQPTHTEYELQEIQKGMDRLLEISINEARKSITPVDMENGKTNPMPSISIPEYSTSVKDSATQFAELMASGMTEDQAYAQMAKE